MSAAITQSIQDYLKIIYDLTGEGSPASTTALAARLGVTPASVTGMLQRLATADPPLIHYRKHQGVTLTAQGERAALEVIRHHRLLESYLVSALGYTWDCVHEEAHRLEHVISEDFEARIAEALGHPERDPHGDPIPTANLTMPPDHTSSLLSLRPPQKAIVRRVSTDDPAFLRHVESLGLIPGARLEVLTRSEFDRVLQLRVNARAQPVTLGPAVAEHIFVEVTD